VNRREQREALVDGLYGEPSSYPENRMSPHLGSRLSHEVVLASEVRYNSVAMTRIIMIDSTLKAGSVKVALKL